MQKGVKFDLFIISSIFLIETKPTIQAVSIPTTSGGIEIETPTVGVENTLYKLTIVPPKIIGALIKKENSPTSFLLAPVIMPDAIVVPLLESPGRSAKV